MIADGVVDLQAEVLLGLVVEVEEGKGALFGDAEGVEDVIAALDGEVGLESASFFERHAISVTP